MNRTDAALHDLVARGTLNSEQADEVRAALARAGGPARPGRWWAEVAGYLGGVLMLGGAALLLGTAWDRLTDAIRGVVLAATALVLAVAGLAIGRGVPGLRRLAAGQSAARRRVVGVLFALAAGSAAAAAGVVANGHEGVAAGAVGLVVAGGGYAALRTVPGLLVTAAASLLLVAFGLAEADAATPFPVGVALLLLGSVWAALAATGVATPRAAGLGVGAALAIAGAQQPLGQAGAQGWAYALTLAVAAACFALYRWQPDAVLLVFGVLGVALAAPEAVWDLTDGAAGGAVILLVAGAALVVASAVGLGLWRAGAGSRQRPPAGHHRAPAQP